MRGFGFNFGFNRKQRGGFNPNSVAGLRQMLLVSTAIGLDGIIHDERSGLGDARDIQPGRAYNFDGTDDYVAVPGLGTFSFVQNTLVFGVSAWVKFDNASQRYVLFGNSISSSDKGFAVLFENGASQGTQAIRFFASKGTSGNPVISGRTSDNVITDTDWHHIAVTSTGAGDNISIYIDGVSQSITYSQTFLSLSSGDSGDIFNIGQANFTSFYMGGSVMDLRIYDDALTSDEIDHIYTFGASGTDPGTANLIAHYKCDDTHPTIAYDSSGNENHGTKTNITAATFHYEGDDVPYSYQNEVGYSPLLEYIQDENNWSSYVSGGVITLPGGTNKFTYYIDDMEDIGITNGETVTLSYDIVSNDGISLRTSTGQGGLGAAAMVIPNTIGTHSVEFEVTDQTKSVQFWNAGSATDSDFIVIDNISLKREETVSGLILLPRNESDITKDVFGNDLQYSGKVPMSAQAINSPCGTFDGTDDYVDVSAAAAALTGEFTISWWAKADLNNIFQFPIGGAGTTKLGYRNNANGMFFRVVSSTASTITVGDVTQLHHITVRRDANDKVDVFFNGGSAQRIFSDAAQSGTFTVNTLGAANASTQFFDGQLFDIRVYDSALSDSDVTKIYSADDISTTPIRWWPFSERSGATAYDVSGNGNHGTITNAVTTTGAGFWGQTQDVFHWPLAKGYNVGKNLLTYTNNLSTDGWDHRGFTFNSSTETDPAGGNTALKFTENNTDNNPALVQIANDITDGTDKTFSVWLRADSPTSIALALTGSNKAGDVNITTVWQRFIVTDDSDGSSGAHIGGFGSVTRNSGIVIYVWHPQAENGTVATDYQSNPTGQSLNGVEVPALADGSADANGNAIGSPAGAYHNGCVTQIDFAPVAAPSTSGWENDWSFNDARTNPLFRRADNGDGNADRFLAYDEALTGDDLTNVNTYTEDA